MGALNASAGEEDWQGSADLAVFPSWYAESFGIVLLEAMAAGSRFALGGDNPGYRTVPGEAPLSLVNPSKPKMLASRILDVLNGAPGFSEAGAWQRSTVWEYDINRIGPSLLKHYGTT
ncbi:MAG: glycosyltransferase [Acidimicrobiia bacterium]